MADEGDGGQATTTYTPAQVEEMVAGLKAKNTELLGKVKSLSEATKSFEGLDPQRAREALAAAEKAEAERAKAVGDWDAREKALRDQFTQEHTKVLEPLMTKAQQLEADLFEAVAGRDAAEAISLPTVKGNAKLLMPIIRPELAVEVIDGRRVTVVKGADGKPRYHPTTGALVTVADRLLELRALPEYGGAFEGAGGSGGGATGGGGAGGVHTIRAGDDKAFLSQLSEIAKGKVRVVGG
jgi:hypothetical protein